MLETFTEVSSSVPKLGQTSQVVPHGKPKADLNVEQVEKMSLQRFGCIFFKPINTHKLLHITLIPQTSRDCYTFTGPAE